MPTAAPTVTLKKKIYPRVANGHPWVYANEIQTIQGAPEAGSTVDVNAADGTYIGSGYINEQSQIVVRILTRSKETIDGAFFFNKIKSAWAYRQRLGYVENCRLVFGEADGLPGLVIDKFNDYLVVQTFSLGMDKWKPAVVDALQKLFSPKGIYGRDDVPVRALEGLPVEKGFLSQPFDTKIEIRENGARYRVDIKEGQKTGYFLDQQDNRKEIRRIVPGADVLGAFCYTGSFEVQAAMAGARSVLGIDISQQAVAQATENARLNGLSEARCRFEALNAFDVLKQWNRDNKRFDVVMLDPPAFTKSRDTIQKAVIGYKEINLRGMKLVKPGGFLVTSSCTNLVPPPMFLEIIEKAAKDARKRLRQVCFRSQSPDHPIINGIESTHYLKFLIAEVGEW